MAIALISHNGERKKNKSQWKKQRKIEGEGVACQYSNWCNCRFEWNWMKVGNTNVTVKF